MIRYFVMALVAMLHSISLADEWVCTTQTSLKINKGFRVCGMGLGLTEAMAREQSLISANSEFKGLCVYDTRCRSSAIHVEPGRTDCRRVRNHFECFRLVDYILAIASDTDPIE